MTNILRPVELPLDIFMENAKLMRTLSKLRESLLARGTDLPSIDEIKNMPSVKNIKTMTVTPCVGSLAKHYESYENKPIFVDSEQLGVLVLLNDKGTLCSYFWTDSVIKETLKSFVEPLADGHKVTPQVVTKTYEVMETKLPSPKDAKCTECAKYCQKQGIYPVIGTETTKMVKVQHGFWGPSSFKTFELQNTPGMQPWAQVSDALIGGYHGITEQYLEGPNIPITTAPAKNTQLPNLDF